MQPDIADIAPFPWQASLHNMIVDATGRNLLEVIDYWIGEQNDEAVYDHDRTRAVAWYTIDAVNSHQALYAALSALVHGEQSKAAWQAARDALAAAQGVYDAN